VLSETTGATTSAYAYAGGPLELDIAGSTYWYLTDTLGSVRLVTDSNGDTPASYAYAAFGSTRTETGSLANEVRFSGERTDTESGLEFLRARTYDPATGTFLQRDTVAITPTASQSIDAYVYTANNPVNAVDPSGHMARMYDEGPVSHGNLHAGSSAYTKPIKAMTAAEKGDLMGGDYNMSGWDNASTKAAAKPTLGHGYTGKVQSCSGLDAICYANTGWQMTGGAAVNYAVEHPAQVLVVVGAVAACAGGGLADPLCVAVLAGAAGGIGGYATQHIGRSDWSWDGLASAGVAGEATGAMIYAGWGVWGGGFNGTSVFASFTWGAEDPIITFSTPIIDKLVLAGLPTAAGVVAANVAASSSVCQTVTSFVPGLRGVLASTLCGVHDR
jgi:RHS repeat-associated protein